MSNTTRRRLLTAMAGAGTGLLVAEGDGLVVRAATTPTVGATAAATPTDRSTELGQVDAPRWSFALTILDDPFAGKLVFPSKVPTGNRVVRAEVAIVNASDQPLDFQNSKVHLVDAEGIEYPAGSAQGSDPSLVSQTLPNGERSRGFVWFIIPETAELAQIKFFAPSPQLRIPIGPK